MKKDTQENTNRRRCSPTGRPYPPLRVVANDGRPPRLRAAVVPGDSTTIQRQPVSDVQLAPEF